MKQQGDISENESKEQKDHAKNQSVINIDGHELRVPVGHSGFIKGRYLCPSEAFAYWMLMAIAKWKDMRRAEPQEGWAVDDVDEYDYAMAWAEWGKLGEGEA